MSTLLRRALRLYLTSCGKQLVWIVGVRLDSLYGDNTDILSSCESSSPGAGSVTPGRDGKSALIALAASCITFVI